MKKGLLLIFLFAAITQPVVAQKWSAPGGIREKPVNELLQGVSVVETEADPDMVSSEEDRTNLSADAGRKSRSGVVATISREFRIKFNSCQII